MAPKGEHILQGIAASPGIAVGPVFVYLQREMEVPSYDVSDAQRPADIARFDAALVETRKQVTKVRDEVKERLGEEEAQIFDAHLLVLEDTAIIDETIAEAERTGRNIDFAFDRVIQRYIQVFEKMDDAFLRERVADIRDVARRLLTNLLGRPEAALGRLVGQGIIATDDLSPSEVAGLDRNQVKGLLTDAGSRTSHAVIMARSIDVPAVVGLHDITTKLTTGTTVLIDGYEGLVILNPSDQTLFRYGRLRLEKQTVQKVFLSSLQLPSETRDGFRTRLLLNIEGSEDAKAMARSGAEGVGLFRTEGLFLRGERFPTEEEQYEVYRRYVAAFAPNTVTLRTLDLGGDKQPPGDLFPKDELNPSLGYRAIRFCLEHPDIFKGQMCAILRASAHGKAKIMFPMISGVSELLEARRMLEESKAELRERGQAYDPAIPVGSMIEIPSAVMTADLLAKHCDFFSIGTNDLIQYTLAVDRVNDRVAHLYDPTHPAVLRLIARTIEAARIRGIPVSVCGEMAGDPTFSPLLIGLGANELSISVSSLAEIKYLIRAMSQNEAKDLARRALDATDPRATMSLLREFYTAQLAPL